MKKTDKQLLFERMNTIGGMPLKEESKMQSVEVSDEDYNKAIDVLNSGVDPSWDRRKQGEMFIGVTGRYQVYYTFWKLTGWNPELKLPPKVIYMGNLSTDILKAAEKARKIGGKQPIALNDVDTIKGMGGMPSDVIGFGKYRGRGIGEVFAEDPQYVIWISNNFTARNNKEQEFLGLARTLADDYFQSMTDTNVASETKDYYGQVGDVFEGEIVIYNIKHYMGEYGTSFGIRVENDNYRFIFYVPQNKFTKTFGVDINYDPNYNLTQETQEKMKGLKNKEIKIKGKVKGHKEIVGKKYTQLNYVKFIN